MGPHTSSKNQSDLRTLSGIAHGTRRGSEGNKELTVPYYVKSTRSVLLYTNLSALEDAASAVLNWSLLKPACAKILYIIMQIKIIKIS
jgi:hypothetical protein